MIPPASEAEARFAFLNAPAHAQTPDHRRPIDLFRLGPDALWQRIRKTSAVV